MKANGLYFLFFTLFLAFACNPNNPTPAVDCSGVVSSYAATAKSVFDADCASSGCHKGPNPSGGIDFSTYAGSKLGAQLSNFICCINHGSGCRPMPDSGSKISDTHIKVLTCWVNSNFPQ